MDLFVEETPPSQVDDSDGGYISRTAALADGGYVVTWLNVEDGSSGQEYSVRAQRFDADGAEVGSQIVVTSSIYYVPNTVTVAGLSDGSFVVSWELPNPGSPNQSADIQARIYGDDGLPVGPQFIANTSTAEEEVNPTAIALNDGGFVLAWRAQVFQGAEQDTIRAQIFDNSGTKIGNEIVVTGADEGLQSVHSGTALADGGFLLTWSEEGPDTFGLRAQAFDAAGTAVSTAFTLASDFAGQMDVRALPNGGFVAVWKDVDWQVHYQIYGADEQKIGLERTVTLPDHVASEVSLATLPSGAFAIVWTDRGPDDPAPKLQAQLFDASGAALDDPQGLAPLAGSPSVATLIDGQIAVVAGSVAGGGGIYQQLIAPPFFGTEGPDTLNGGPGEDHFFGLGSGDTLFGGFGDDYILGGDGNDTIMGDQSSFSQPGFDGSDELAGDAGNDVIYGGAGDDTITGGTGFDQIDGGVGQDHINGGDGDDIITGFGLDRHYGHVDNDVDVLLGGAGNDRITVGYGDFANGGGGRDTLYLDLFTGPAGVTIDLSLLANSGSIVIAGGELRNIEFVGGISLTQFDDTAIAGPIPTGTEGITMDGWGGNDTLTGTAGVDFISGGDGNDTIHGGGGLDPSIAPAGDRLAGEGGDDTIYIGADDAYAMGGAGSDTIYGGNRNDEISGDDGNDVLNGGSGADGIQGGHGNDQLAGDAGDDTLLGGSGQDQLAGGDGNDTIYGGADDDTLSGGAGDDWLNGETGTSTLDGGAGDDVLLGGAGGDLLRGGSAIDTASYAAFGAGVTVNLAHVGAQNTGSAGIDTLERIENLFGSSGTDMFWGNGQANELVGNGGNDVLNGVGGDDTLSGGYGDDLYYIDTGGDVVNESADAGWDVVRAGVDYTLTDNVEELFLAGAARIGTGNALANVLRGSASSNTLAGLAGDDIIRGSGGRDTIDGGDGADLLDGGVGKDTLTGGAGRDVFQFRDGDFGTTRALADVITDFSHGSAEKIHLSLVDANVNAGGNQAFAFIGSGAFTGVAGQLHYAQQAGNTYVEGDTNGDGLADFVIALTGLHTLAASDFVL